MKRLITFAFLWLMVGFTTGTTTLLGPVRWITGYGRSQGWTEGAERVVVVPLIGAFVVGSALVAFWLTAIVLRTSRAHVRLGVPFLCAGAAAGTLWLWMTPEMMAANMGAEERVGASFTFGSYATEERMVDLRRQGYTAVVSLLHPLVVPFEPKLIAEGRAAAERVGIRYINVPMLPWVSDNAEALAQIDELVASGGNDRYYVHCYLGRDRVRLVKRRIQEVDPTARVDVTPELEVHAAAQRLSEGMVLERGAIVMVDRDVYLTPYPVDSEYMSYILPGRHGHVVSLLDPDSAEDLPWIEKERELLEGNRVRFELRPLPLGRFDPQLALAVAREAARMPRPFVVHAFLALESGRSPAAEAFVQAFRSNLPPLPPALFAPPLAGGTARVLAPNVAAGPQPAADEFSGPLFDRGVREWVYVGDGTSEQARQDREICAVAGLSWRSVPRGGPELISLLSSGGPWYLYGPEAASLEPDLESRLGPAIPERMRWNPESSKPATQSPSTSSLIEFSRSIMPSARSIVLLGPLLLLATSLAALLAGWLRTARGVKTAYTRKIFHFVIFTTAGGLHLVGGLPTVALYGGIVSFVVLYAVWRGEGFAFFEALARPSDAPRRALFVLVPLATTAVGGLSANLFFGAAAPIGYLVAGWGDAIAEPVGARWGRHRYRVPSIAGVPATRSLEGSAAVLSVGSLAAFVGLWLAGVPAPSSLAVAAACGVAGAGVEAVSNHGLDNLTVQLAAAGTAYVLLP
jgi:phytol kinase